VTPRTAFRARWVLMMLVVAPALGGCGTSLSDYSLKDEEWFSRPAKIFNRSLSIEAPPLSQNAAISSADLITAEGACAGVALAEGQSAASGSVALGHSECDVARAAGKPDNVNLSTNEQGERVAVLTYTHGSRPGIYRFIAGRLTDVQSVASPDAPARTSKKNRA
jgi:hypothetical protein